VEMCSRRFWRRLRIFVQTTPSPSKFFGKLRCFYVIFLQIGRPLASVDTKAPFWFGLHTNERSNVHVERSSPAVGFDRRRTSQLP
jgi:hypothetical protein